MHAELSKLAAAKDNNPRLEQFDSKLSKYIGGNPIRIVRMVSCSNNYEGVNPDPIKRTGNLGYLEFWILSAQQKLMAYTYPPSLKTPTPLPRWYVPQVSFPIRDLYPP